MIIWVRRGIGRILGKIHVNSTDSSDPNLTFGMLSAPHRCDHRPDSSDGTSVLGFSGANRVGMILFQQIIKTKQTKIQTFQEYQ